MKITLEILLILALLGFSAFFSGSEITLAYANKIRIKKAAEEGNRRAAVAQYISDHYASAISAILLGNNLVNLSTSTLATLIAASLIASEGLAQTVATVTVTVLLLIFGEIIPKVIGMEFCDKLVLAVARPMRIFMKLCYPVIRPMELLLDKMSVLWTPKSNAPTVTAEELVTIVDEMEEEGGFTEEEGNLIRSAIEFNELTAKDILTPRVDILAYDLEDDIGKLISDKDLLSYSRFPVYEGSMDKIVGILSTREFVRAYLTKGKDVDVRSLLTPPMYVHMTRDISSILPEMRENGCEMAVVLDEFGGTLGILTAEDIVEQIVGEIFDEGDEVENDVINRGNYLEIDGSMSIHEFFDQMELDEEEFDSEYTTVGGFVTEMLDKIPEAGDSFEYENLTVHVTEVKDNRVEKILVKVGEKPDPDKEK
ncbi:MAG: hemolysin family protein [Eubacteriales bacterium]